MPRDLDAEAAKAQREEAIASWRKDADNELAAMHTAFDALCELPRDSRGRALRWLEARLDNAPFYGECPF